MQRETTIHAYHIFKAINLQSGPFSEIIIINYMIVHALRNHEAICFSRRQNQ